MKEITASDIKNTKNKAKTRKILYSVTIDYLNKIFKKQNGKCALSGLPIHFSDIKNGIREKTASLDRIDSNRGYVKGNVQWVHKHVNNMKWDFDQGYFIEVCGLITENMKK